MLCFGPIFRFYSFELFVFLKRGTKLSEVFSLSVHGQICSGLMKNLFEIGQNHIFWQVFVGIMIGKI